MKKYYFLEKNIGVIHFSIVVEERKPFPTEHAAALLAMHCVVRRTDPNNYVVLREVETNEGLAGKTMELIKSVSRKVRSDVKLSRREEEVLGGIMRSLANKEIASELNLSVRTVKFHVSSLLNKFKVRGRVELYSEATREF